MSGYYEKCVERPKEQRQKLGCVFEKLVSSWKDPLYDADILIFLAHVVWAVSVYWSIAHPDAFTGYTSISFAQWSDPLDWALGSLIIGFAHCFVVFIRNVGVRLISFLASSLWGAAVCAAVLYYNSWSMGFFFYALVFVFLPFRKMVSIYQLNKKQYIVESNR